MSTTEPEGIAVIIARVEGKLDLSKSQNDQLQRTLEEIKSAMREDRVGSEQRLKDHVEAVNPHPAQEAWLREIHTAHALRLGEIERTIATSRGVSTTTRWVVNGVIAVGSGAFGALVSVLSHHH